VEEWGKGRGGCWLNPLFVEGFIRILGGCLIQALRIASMLKALDVTVIETAILLTWAALIGFTV